MINIKNYLKEIDYRKKSSNRHAKFRGLMLRFLPDDSMNRSGWYYILK